MIKFSGPLLALWNFHPDLLKICSMHTLNLGQLFVCNGAAMMLVCYGLTFLTHFFRVLYCGHTFLCFFVYMPIRNLLLDTGAFGDPALPLQQRLDTAYKEFTAWLRQHKIQCSQSHFMNGMVFGIEEIPVCFATDNF